MDAGLSPTSVDHWKELSVIVFVLFPSDVQQINNKNKYCNLTMELDLQTTLIFILFQEPTNLISQFSS